MKSATPLPQASYRFRTAILDALAHFHEPEDFFYIDSDTAIVRCAVCGGRASVRFHGRAPRADLKCIDNDCPEDEQVAKLSEVTR